MIPFVKAEGDIDLTQFPQDLADQLGVSLFAGQLLASAIFICMFLFPAAILLRKEHQFVTLGLLFILMGCCIAFTWLPFWFLIVIVFGVAADFAIVVGKKVGG